MKNILIFILIALSAQAFVLDFPGDVAPEPEREYAPQTPYSSASAANLPPQAAADYARAQQLLSAPSGQWQQLNLAEAPSEELDPQLIVLLSMMSPRKLYALKLALDRMFEQPAAAPEPPAAAPRELKITVHGSGGASTYREQLAPQIQPAASAPREQKLQIQMR